MLNSPSRSIPSLLIGLLLAIAASADEPQPVDFDSQIRPILTQYCTACHGGVKQAGDVSFIYRDQVLPPDGWVVEPGDPEASSLIERITSDDPDMRMPPPDEHPDPVPADKIALLERWIEEGAEWGEMWAMSTLPSHDKLPNVSDSPNADSPNADSAWPRQPLDHFVQDRWQEVGLSHADPAPPEQWLRRASMDIIGLPPTLEEIESFAKSCDNANDAAQRDAVYQREVDRLLASKHFGERWAVLWMDLARYADSQGFEKDSHRDMWPYRDWLIRAFNADMPYDEFTIKQLAGDLLPNPTADDIIATAFHRNTQTNTEGGTDDEEFRIAATIDRINTTWTVWQATTMGCVQCHSHPYDALKHDEYYASMALFNSMMDADLNSDWPTMKVSSDPARRDADIAAQLAYEKIRQHRNQLGIDQLAGSEWKPIKPLAIHTTGGNLKIDQDQVRVDGGTFPVGVVYTFEGKAEAMTALRIEIFPEVDNPESSAEQGAVLSHLKAEWIAKDGTATPLELADVYVDGLVGPDDPRDALKNSSTGVGEFPKLNGPRQAYFLLRERFQADADATIRLTMAQKASTTGNIAAPIRRFRWSVADDPALPILIASDRHAAADQELIAARAAANGIKGAALPVTRSRPPNAQRPTRVFVRGNWLERGDEIEPGIPAAFQRDDKTVDTKDRLQFARWLVSDANPLAARVWANRIWAELFGAGIVVTQEDFGSSGLKPSHPRLLNHLASRIRDHHGWHLKPMLREIVLSATYRQTNAASLDVIEKDKTNRWLARGPRTRLTAEMVRDQALVASGLLNEQIGGPSVMPPQPDGVWQTIYNRAKWVTAKGPQRYRRGVYTYWRRTSPYPSFLLFDSPTRDLCSARRISTNTPLQALVTLNDPVFYECSEALAAQAIKVRDDLPGQIRWMFEAVTGQRANDLELTTLQSLYEQLVEDTKDDEPAKEGDPTKPDEPAKTTDEPSGTTPTAMVIVANTILNLDKAMTK